MGNTFNVRKYLRIPDDIPVELRICHIAELWYKKVLSGKIGYNLNIIYDFFPELVIIAEEYPGKEIPPAKIDYTTYYITAYRNKGSLKQGSENDVPQIVRCLFGSVTQPRLADAANKIQKRVAKELCADNSKITDLRDYYARLIKNLSSGQRDCFMTVFKAYIDAVVDDLGNYPNYAPSLFPFASEQLVLDLNNNYLTKEFNSGNYADFFLWMNLAALLRNEISSLINTYDSSFTSSGTNPAATDATKYHDLGMAYYAQHDNKKALEFSEKALAIRESVLGSNHEETAATYNNLGVLYEEMGDYGKAIEYFGKALAVFERITDKGIAAASSGNMANAYKMLGDYRKAIEYYRKSINFREEMSGKDCPEIASTYDSLAGVYVDLVDDYVKAQVYYEKALAIRERAFGKAHPETAKTYHNMAVLYYKQGDYKKALELMEKVLAIHEHAFGKRHPNTVRNYFNLAQLYEEKGDYKKALEYLKIYVQYTR